MNTYKLFLRTDNTNIDGSNSLYLLFTSKRKLKKISLDIKVNKKDWNNSKTEVKRTDPDFLRKNKYIRKYDKKAKDIIDKYFFDDKYLSVDEFVRQFKNENFGSISFYDFIETEMETLIISKGTYNNYLKQISKLKSFRTELLFTDIDHKFLNDYDYFLKNQRENNDNTRIASKNFIRQAVNKAKKQGITDIEPFKYFTIGKMTGNREHLTKSELDKLDKLLLSDDLINNEKEVLEYFLFACYTGLRFSDVQTLKYSEIQTDKVDNIEYKFIVKKMQKTGKATDIPILPYANKFIRQTEIPNKFIFNVQTNQGTNRVLKRIMEKAQINKNITFHCARHTLGSTGSDLGMRIEIISSILGHSELKETQGYSKISRRAKIESMQKMEHEN